MIRSIERFQTFFYNVPLSDVHESDKTEVPRIVTELCDAILENGTRTIGLFHKQTCDYAGGKVKTILTERKKLV